MQINKTTITFDLKLHRGQVRQFRGAIDEKISTELGDHDLFHNHDNSEGRIPKKYIHRYPLIQYQKQYKTHRAQIVGLGEGSKALLHTFLDNYDGQLHINREWISMKVLDFQHEQNHLEVSENFHTYRLHNWLALKDKSYRQWKQSHKLTNRIQILEQQLANNILGFANGVGWKIPEKFDLYLTDYQAPSAVTYRNKERLLLFNVQWEGNIVLPNGIGLGKGTSEGKGRLISC